MGILTRLWEWTKSNFLRKEFGLFIIIGGINTVNGTVLAFLFSRFFQANLAFIMGYVSALVIAFFLNTFFIFKVKPEFSRFLKFALSYVPNFIIQNAVVAVVYNVMRWHELIAFVLAAAIGIPVTFLLLKGFAFKSKP